jgi:hypothetical protein
LRSIAPTRAITLTRVAIPDAVIAVIAVIAVSAVSAVSALIRGRSRTAWTALSSVIRPPIVALFIALAIRPCSTPLQPVITGR